MNRVTITRTVGAAISVSIFATVLALSFSPATSLRQSFTGPVFGMYLVALLTAVIFWKRLRGWADGYIAGFVLGIFTWLGKVVVQSMIG